MSMVYAKCPNCGQNVLVDSIKEASICEYCSEAFVTEKAINAYNGITVSTTNKPAKKRHIGKSLLKGLLMTLECLGYLFYVLFFLWLFIDLTDGLKKK